MSFYGIGQEFAMLEDAIEAGGMAWWIMELPSGVVFFSPNKIKLLGYTEKEVSKFVHYSNFTDLVHPDDYEKCMKAMKDHIEGKTKLYETQYRIKTKEIITMGHPIAFWVARRTKLVRMTPKTTS